MAARKVIAFHNGTSATKYTGKVTVDIECVTPELATEWLTKNKRNRKLTPRRAESIACQIASDLWEVTNQGIGFDAHGNLVDGQHRLTGIRDAGKAVFLPVFRNLSPRVIDIIDHNMKSRSVADILTINGIGQANRVAMIARQIHNATVRGAASLPFIIGHATAVWEKFSDDIDWAFDVFTDMRRHASRGPVVAGMVYAHSVYPRKIADFAKMVYDGIGLSEGSPAHKLRVVIESANFTTDGDRLAIFHKTLRAAQFHCTGQDFKRLSSGNEGLLYFKHLRQAKGADAPDPVEVEADAAE